MNTPIFRVGTAMWQLQEVDAVVSTNDLARELSAWSAITARSQSAGRGRFGRKFHSQPGGLWLSAVMPAGGPTGQWSGFSLMVGEFLRQTLADLGVPVPRLRWPNDIMVAEKKLAGILIENNLNDTLTIGLGINVENTPWSEAPELTSTTTRLADLLPDSPDLHSLTIRILDALADAHEAMQTGGLKAATALFNAQHEPRRVTLLLSDGLPLTGQFAGLDDEGNLRLLDDSGTQKVLAHTRIERLAEEST